jgi:hypothetical protein
MIKAKGFLCNISNIVGAAKNKNVNKLEVNKE